MVEERVQRRLVAILAADMVSYSRLMEADETGTISRQKAHRSELIEPKIAVHRGRIVKTTGDGMLVEFPSVVEATECALAIQRSMAEREASVSEDRRIQYRIGINLGDIVIDGDDILGDGVNIAARLEGLSKPGGVCISDVVHQSVLGKLDLAFEDLGQQQVRNITKPVHAYQVILEPAQTAAKFVGSAQTDKPSIAVMPFDNMSGDPEQEYFVNGLAEDIITALSKIERMRVIARNSTFAYRGQAFDLLRIAGELGVRYVLEGSVRRGGNRLRITAQLIDADDGSHLWAERYDRPVDDLFDIQDEITKEIVTSLRVKLTDGEVARVWARGTNNIEAWQYAIRAFELIGGFVPSGLEEARALAKKATEIDPEYALAWAALGWVHWMEARFGITGASADKFVRANELAERAMDLDDSASYSIGLKALVAAPLGRHDEGVKVARRGIELYPGNADVRAFLGLALLFAGYYREAEEQFRAAMSLNPFHPTWYRASLARTLAFQDEFDEALNLVDEILEIEPSNFLGWMIRAYACSQVNLNTDARKAITEIRRIAPELTCRQVPGFLLIRDETAIDRFVDGMRKAGMPE